MVIEDSIVKVSKGTARGTRESAIVSASIANNAVVSFTYTIIQEAYNLWNLVNLTLIQEAIYESKNINR